MSRGFAFQHTAHEVTPRWHRDVTKRFPPHPILDQAPVDRVPPVVQLDLGDQLLELGRSLQGHREVAVFVDRGDDGILAAGSMPTAIAHD
ncbi:hypothetical protein BAY60_35765 (plasmid) [Prauserella muralis]|uniref:Uncharacterized protein n=1 Tax=Prauserella muralis TaxID=588067 RepID=A0A2V4ABT3_9PSEU|nr:hypothetical protein BAY60_35765 [Prauserella muralis]TWE11203.1 hypothetical protein FHX69_7422 [Prauserella muralis]